MVQVSVHLLIAAAAVAPVIAEYSEHIAHGDHKEHREHGVLGGHNGHEHHDGANIEHGVHGAREASAHPHMHGHLNGREYYVTEIDARDPSLFGHLIKGGFKVAHHFLNFRELDDDEDMHAREPEFDDVELDERDPFHFKIKKVLKGVGKVAKFAMNNFLREEDGGNIYSRDFDDDETELVARDLDDDEDLYAREPEFDDIELDERDPFHFKIKKVLKGVGKVAKFAMSNFLREDEGEMYGRDFDDKEGMYAREPVFYFVRETPEYDELD